MREAVRLKRFGGWDSVLVAGTISCSSSTVRREKEDWLDVEIYYSSQAF